MSKLNAIIILASQPNPKTWDFPKQVYSCMDRAIELFHKSIAPYIIVSGKWTVTFDYLAIEQPFRECDKMAEYLIQNGVPRDKILIEGDSKDTISNLYYIKKQILIPKNMKSILFVVAEFRIPRIRLLAKKVLGSSYEWEFEGIPSEADPNYHENNTTKMQSQFLEPMKEGDDSWLDDKFYTGWLYDYWKERALQKKPDKS